MSAFGEKHACRRFPAALLCVGLLSLAAPASAQSSADDLARRHFESGVAYLEESDYENALRAFEKSYELSRRPEILLNIAVVHERLGTLSDAIAALRQYLAEAPEGEHVETVRRRIENLEKRLPTQSAAEPAAETAEALNAVRAAGGRIVCPTVLRRSSRSESARQRRRAPCSRDSLPSSNTTKRRNPASDRARTRSSLSERAWRSRTRCSRAWPSLPLASASRSN